MQRMHATCRNTGRMSVLPSGLYKSVANLSTLSPCKHWAHWMHLSWAYDQISLCNDFLESWELHFSLFIKKLKSFCSLIHFILTCVTLIISCMTLLVSIPAWCHSTDDSTIGMCCALSSLMSFYIHCRALWIPFTATVWLVFIFWVWPFLCLSQSGSPIPR